MFSFREDNGISLFFGGKAILTDIIPWVNARKRPMEPFADDYIFARPSIVASDRIEFRDESGALTGTLTLKAGKDTFALFLSSVYDASRILGHGTHVSDFKGFGFTFDMPYIGNYQDVYILGAFWQRCFISSDISKVKEKTQFFTVKHPDGYHVMLLSACHKDYKSDIFSYNEKLSLEAHSNTVKDDIDNECVLIGAVCDDPYKLSEKATAYGIKVMNKRKAKLRKNKKYPEIFEYVGWCSWDAFYTSVTAEGLYNKAKELSEKDIPIKWMTIDDEWADVTAITLPTLSWRELNDWEADPVRFPNGLKGAVEDIKRDFDLKVGIWHPTSGYWAGINPLGPLAKRYPELLEYVTPRADGYYPILSHSFDKKKIMKYYDLQHKFYKDCGIDYTKVDNQGWSERHCYNKGTIGECITNLHNAIDGVSWKYYDGAIINCMGMPIENYWNRDTTVNRVSDDFKPENRKWFIQHILQCSYNCFTQGAMYVGDWDMWWSDDAQASKNAVLRAMSGGPIYISDELGRSIKDVIMPTVFSDGRITRLSDPAVPTADCLFEDSEHNGKIFKVFNRIGDHGVIAAFNLSEDESKVKGKISPYDVKGIKRGKYCVYDWFSGETKVLNRKESFTLSLENYDDFRLYILAPVLNGKAVIGLKEKYMTAAAVKIEGNTVTSLDDGTLLVYSETALEGFTKEENGIHTIPVAKGQTITL